MDSTWEAICIAIGTSLLSIKKELPESIDWQNVYGEAKKQGITGIIYPVIAKMLPAELHTKWERYHLQVISKNTQLLHEQKEMCSLLYNEEIPFCILKGTAAAIYYPMPLLRNMGDIDFWVPPEFFQKAEKLLVANGYTYIPGGEDYDRHVSMKRNGILFEQHRFFSTDEVDANLFKGIKHLQIREIRNVRFPMLPPLENGIILLEHIHQHLKTGLGLRQILDWMMYVQDVLDDGFWQSSFKDEAERCGLQKLAIVSTHMCQIYFGLTDDVQWCKDADDTLCKRLMTTIIEAGNFGINHGKGKDFQKTVVRLRTQGILKYLQLAGELHWEAYQKHHWLKPLAWAYQICRYIRQGIETGRSSKSIGKDLSIGYERYNLLRDLELESYF